MTESRLLATVQPASDPRLATDDVLTPLSPRRRRALRMLIAVNLLLGLWYFVWLLSPSQEGTLWLYAILVAAEVFNLVQAAGFWWTIRSDRHTSGPHADDQREWPAVDVLIPVYNEPVDVVEATVAGAIALEGGEITVYLLDDGDSMEMRALARRHGARYVTRTDHRGAKAGNINHALPLTSAPFIAIFDCDHVPAPEFLTATLGSFDDAGVAFVQTPQYYANRTSGHIAAAAAAQQDLFFGIISRGKARNQAMFCCGTNFVFRRTAFDSVGGFPENSLTEDFELSMLLHREGWRSVYIPTVLARGLGPEDMASYVSQQARWAQGCLSALPRILRSGLPPKLRAQYLLSSLYFLSGWTVTVYIALPILRIFGHVQPIHPGSANQFLAHFIPYFAASLLTVAVASDGAFSFGAYSLSVINFTIHLRATVRTVLGRRGKFVVTPKHGTNGAQLRPIVGGLVAISALSIAVVYALSTHPSAALLTNVAFALLWIGLLACGAWPALGLTRTHLPAQSLVRPASNSTQPVLLEARSSNTKVSAGSLRSVVGE
jgi:cellulose synthase (UDP-forming)